MEVTNEQICMIEELFMQMFHPLRVYAMAVFHSDELADAAVQETFRMACLQADRLEDSMDREVWLIDKLKSICQSMRKERERWSNLINALIASRRKIEASQLLDDADVCLLLKLVREDCSVLSLAKGEGITQQDCRERLQNAEQKLVKYLGEDAGSRHVHIVV